MSKDDSRLDPNKLDTIAALARGAIGGVPYVGGLIGEVVGTLIPRQRLDRLIEFVRELNDRLGELSEDLVRDKVKTAEFADLLEDGLYQAARALTPERRCRIASALKNAITNEELDHLLKKRLLQLFGEVNDVEIIILRSLTNDPSREHRDFLIRQRATVEGPASLRGRPPRITDESVVHRSYRDHLRQLRLTSPRFKKPRHGESPEIDEETGLPESWATDKITTLGTILLRFIDEQVNRGSS